MLNWNTNGTPLAAKKSGSGFIVMIAIEHAIGDHAVVFYRPGKTEWEFAFGYCSDYGKAEQLFEMKCKDASLFA